MTIFDRIRELRQKKGWSMDELAQKVGYLGRSAISKVENGERMISHEMLIKYSDVFDVSPMYLLFGEEDNKKNNDSPGKTFPVLKNISQGNVIYTDEPICMDADIEADFCIIMRDNSMSGARINEGDVVFIKQGEGINKNGDMVAITINDDFTLRYWYYYPEQKKLVLNSPSPSIEPLIYTGKEIKTVTVLGRAVCFMSEL